MAYGNWKSQSPLYGVRVPPRGPAPAEFAFVTDRPGKGDPRAGHPLSGTTGQEFSRYLALAGLTRANVYTTCIVKDYQDDEPTPEEVSRDQIEFLEEMDRCSPTFICPLGRFATRHLLGDVDMEQVHGILFPGDDYGYPGQYIYPCFHPASGLHSSDAIPLIEYDFRGLAGPFTSRMRPGDEHPLPEYRQYCGTDLLLPTSPIAIDSEGYLHDPWSLQTSQVPGTALIVPRGPAVAEWNRSFNRFWSAGGRVILHNSLHDLQVLSALGVHVRDGQFVDTMVLSYLLCTHPQGLKPLAFRFAGMKMADYQEVTGVARAMVHGEWLASALSVSESLAAPEWELVWDDKKAGWRVKKPQTIHQRLTRLDADIRSGKTRKDGTPLDIAERVANWEDSAAGELREICGEVPEPTLNDIPRADADRYACRDADATLRIYPRLWQEVVDRGLEEVSTIDHAIVPIVNQMQINGMLIDPEHFRRMDEELTMGMSDLRDQVEAMVGVRINPGSSPQVADLLFKQLGLPSRKLTRGGDDSTQDKVLEGLRKEHPVLPLILDYRELDKIRGSFCRKMPKLAGKDNRVRGNIRVTRTASGRLAMNTPNLMAIPVRSSLGRRLREGFIASPGCVIGNWDLDQIEMREIADVSQDPLLMDVFSDPRRDIHDETASRMFDKPIHLIDPKTERYAAKRVGFGIATQITGAGLVDQMELAGATHADGSKWTDTECDGLIELWFGVYPGVRRFIDRTKAEVRRTGEVRDRWGRLRYLPGVHSYIPRIREESLRQGPSHKIQAGAQGYMKKAMARIWGNIRDMPEVKPLLQIHDSIMLEFPEGMWALVNEIVLDGLQNAHRYSVPITASGEYGLNWGKMQEE